jgi:hypothetical protein
LVGVRTATSIGCHGVLGLRRKVLVMAVLSKPYVLDNTAGGNHRSALQISVEFNNIHSSGFYAADVALYIDAIERRLADNRSLCMAAIRWSQ